MLLPIKPICSANKTLRDGTSTIFLQYCFSASNRTLLNTGIKIPPHYWNTKQLCISNKLPPSFGNYQKLNDELTKLTRIAEDLVTFAANNQVTDKGSFVKSSFCTNLNIATLQHIKTDSITKKAVEQKIG